MSEDDKQDPSSAPGSGAGDAAPTQEIPRIPKPKTSGAKRPAGLTTAKKTSAKKAPAKKTTSTAGTQTDKGRPRETPAPPEVTKPAEETKQSKESKAPVGDKAESSPASGTKDGSDVRPVGGPPGRPLTAADYARTTRTSPAATAVIPAIRDKIDKVKERDKKKPKPAATFAPAPESGSTRRASLRLTHVEPWSVTRLAFAISVAMMIVAVVAVTIFWVVLEITGVWDRINGSVTTVLSDDSSSFSITDYLGFGRMVGLTLVLSAINVILTTALATIGAHLYNLAAQLLGGVEVTFAEDK